MSARLAALLAVTLATAAQADEPDCGAGVDAPLCRFAAMPLSVAPEGRLLPGHPHPYHRVLSPLRFTDAAGRDWRVPRGALTDGASIPPLLTGLVGAPRSPEFAAAAALHDAACGAGNEALSEFHARPWEEVHAMFYDALRAAGVSRTKAAAMFAAVYLAGPRWDDPARSLAGVADDLLRQEMEWCLDFIAATDPSRAEIVAWMRDREADLIAGTPAPPVLP